MNATPCKLRSGEWGARVQGNPTEGTVVTITTRAGKSWDTSVRKVIWKGDGVAICATDSLRRGSRSIGGSYDACHTDGNCSSVCALNSSCPCFSGGWFDCC